MEPFAQLSYPLAAAGHILACLLDGRSFHSALVIDHIAELIGR